jgi:hypothetical protein
MAFELRVSFTGLCLYLVHPDGTKAAVLLPDARKTTADPAHADGTMGEFHAAYLRFDLAHLDARFPAGSEDEVPRYEVVRRLDRQVLDFGVPDGAGQTVDLPLPDFGTFAPTLRPISGLFSSNPPQELLSRMVLNGGELSALPEDAWTLPATLNPGGQPYNGEFASLVTWTRQVEGDGLTLTLAGFDGADAVQIPLTPVTTDSGARVIALKVANLCDKNVLEWPELGTRRVDQDDVDFKWLYRLLQPEEGSYGDRLEGSSLPIPHLQPTQGFGVEDCMGGKIEVVFP